MKNLYNNFFKHFVFRRRKFEELLTEYEAEIDKYKDRQIPMTVAEIKKHLVNLKQLSVNLEAAKEDYMVRILCQVEYKLAIETLSFLFPVKIILVFF